MMKKYFYLMLMMTVGFGIGHCAFESKEISSYRTSLGGISSVICDEALSVFYNPASIQKMSKKQLQTSYTELFGIKELGFKNLAYTLPTKKYGSFGFGYSCFGGSDIYKEEVSVVSYAYTFSKKQSVGLSIKNMSIYIPSDSDEFGSTSVVGVDLGFLIECSNKLRMGCVMRNVNRPKVGKYLPEEVYRDFSVGYWYGAAESVNVYSELSKPIGYSLVYRLGLEFGLTKHFFIRSGLQINPSYYALGFRTLFSNIILDYAYKYHPSLGTQHLMSLGIKH